MTLPRPVLRGLLAVGVAVLAALQGVGLITLGLPLWAGFRFGRTEALWATAGLAAGLVGPALLLAQQSEALAFLHLALSLPFVAGVLILGSGLFQRTFYRLCAASVVTALAIIPGWVSVLGSEEFLQGFRSVLTQVGLLPLSNQEGLNEEMFQTYLTNALNVLHSYFLPMVLVLFGLTLVLAQRLSLPPDRWAFLARFRLPDGWIYGCLAGLGFYAWGLVRAPSWELQVWELVVSNLGWSFLLLYALQALGILYYLIQSRWGRLGALALNLVWAGMWFLTVSLNLWHYLQPGLVALAAFGASETWIRYRTTHPHKEIP